MAMSSSAQKQAVNDYRRRLEARGLSRFEVLGRQQDKALIREIARRLAEDDVEADSLRAEIGRRMSAKLPRKGGIVAALRRSPLVGADLDLTREEITGRDVAL